MAIETPLINLYNFLSENITTDEQRAEYNFWGRNVLYKAVPYFVRYGKGGKILSIGSFDPVRVFAGTKVAKKTGVVTVKTKAVQGTQIVPIWFKTRSSGKMPYPFCDTIDNFCDSDYVAIYGLARKAVFGDMTLPPCVEDWFKAIPNLQAAIEDYKANNKVPKSFGANFVKFVYEDDATSLTVRPEVMELMTANNYEMRYKWFSQMPKLAAAVCGKSKKKSEDDDEEEVSEDVADDGEIYYDVVDDKPLKLSEVYLGHIGQVFGGGFNLTPVSYNIKENNKGESDCRNYPMSKKHGEMMDAVLSWLYKPSTPTPYVGEDASRDAMAQYEREKRAANYTSFSHDNHNYLWFPVINADDDDDNVADNKIEDMDELIDKFMKMNHVLRDMLDGIIDSRLEFDEKGYLLDNEANRKIIPWLSDDEIYLYEVPLNGKRMTLIEHPFSIETLIKNIHAFNMKMVANQIDAKHAPINYAEIVDGVDTSNTITNAMKKMVAHVCDEMFIGWSKPTPALRLWKDYLYNHIYQGRPSSKELLHKIRQKLVYDLDKYNYQFNKSANGFDRTAMLTELCASLGLANIEDIKEDKAYKAGRIMAYLASKQKELKLPISFAMNRMHAVYSGAVDLKSELEKFVTLSPAIKEARRAEYARYTNQANKLKEKGNALGVNLGWDNILKTMNVDISKFYRANAKTAFGVALAAIATTLGKKARNTVDADFDNKTDFGSFIGYIHNRIKELGDGCRISSDADKTKFILGFYTRIDNDK